VPPAHPARPPCPLPHPSHPPHPPPPRPPKGPDVGVITAANLELHAGGVEDAWQVAAVEVAHPLTGQAVRFAFVGWVDSDEAERAGGHAAAAAAAAAARQQAGGARKSQRKRTPAASHFAVGGGPDSPPGPRDYDVAVTTSDVPGAATECEVRLGGRAAEGRGWVPCACRPGGLLARHLCCNFQVLKGWQPLALAALTPHTYPDPPERCLPPPRAPPLPPPGPALPCPSSLCP
jgi:hypothetical protein